MKKIFMLSLVVVLIISLSLIGFGCKTTAAAEETTAAAEETTAAAEETEAAAETIKIGAPYRILTDEFHNAMNLAAQKKADELGIEYIPQDARDSQETQNQQIENFISLGVDALLLGGPIDAAGVVPALKKVNEANIPVIIIDSKPSGGKAEMFISFDNTLAAKKAGEGMIKGFMDRDGEVPEGVILEITGALGNTAQDQRHAGFDNVVNEELYPQLTIVQGEGKWNPDDAFTVTSDLVTKYGDEIIGLYMHTDAMATGIISALEKGGLDPTKMIITGLDASPAGLKFITEGKILMLPLQDAFAYSSLGIQYLYDIVNGKEIPKVGDTVVEEGAFWSPATVIEDPEGVCPIMLISGVNIPWDVPTDSLDLWANVIGK